MTGQVSVSPTRNSPAKLQNINTSSTMSCTSQMFFPVMIHNSRTLSLPWKGMAPLQRWWYIKLCGIWGSALSRSRSRSWSMTRRWVLRRLSPPSTITPSANVCASMISPHINLPILAVEARWWDSSEGYAEVHDVADRCDLLAVVKGPPCSSTGGLNLLDTEEKVGKDLDIIIAKAKVSVRVRIQSDGIDGELRHCLGFIYYVRIAIVGVIEGADEVPGVWFGFSPSTATAKATVTNDSYRWLLEIRHRRPVPTRHYRLLQLRRHCCCLHTSVCSWWCCHRVSRIRDVGWHLDIN